MLEQPVQGISRINVKLLLLHRNLQLTEEQLVESLRRSEDTGFAYFYEHYSGALFSTVLGFISDRKMAEDVLQEVFLNIFRKIDSYDNRYRLYTYMVSIARNLLIDTVKSRAYRNNRQNGDIVEMTYNSNT